MFWLHYGYCNPPTRSNSVLFLFNLAVTGNTTQTNLNQNRIWTNQISDTIFFYPKEFLTQKNFQPKFFLPRKVSDPCFLAQNNFQPKFFLTLKNFRPNFFRPKFFWPNLFLTQILFNQNNSSNKTTKSTFINKTT